MHGMPTKFSGEYVVLYLSESGADDFKLWSCCRTLTYVEQSEFIEVTPIDGVQTSYLPTYQGQTISAQGLYIEADNTDPQYSSVQLYEWLRAKQLLDFRIIAGTDVYSGSCYLQNVSSTGANDQAAEISIEAVCVSQNAAGSQMAIACPVITFSGGTTTRTLSFTASVSATSYVIKCYDGTTLIDTKTITPPYATPVTTTFTGLTPNKAYGFIVTIYNTTTYYSRTCDRVTSNTNAINCPTVTLTPTTTTIGYSFNDGGQGVDSWAVQLKQGGTLIDTDTFTAPYTNPLTGTFTGLTPATSYDVYLVATEGAYTKTCGPTNTSTSFTYEFSLQNSLSGATVTAIQQNGSNFVTYTSGSLPVASGSTVYGTHDAFTGAIQVTVSGLFANGNMVLNVNGGYVECVNFNGISGTHSFSSATYGASDLIQITINEGDCA
jgi:hypothetical protein